MEAEEAQKVVLGGFVMFLQWFCYVFVVFWWFCSGFVMECNITIVKITT